MEAERNTLGEVDDGDGGPGEVGGVEDDQVASGPAGVMDIGDDVTLVFTSGEPSGNEDPLTREPPGAEVVRLAGPGVEVVLDETSVEAAVIELTGQVDGVAVPVPVPCAALVDAGKLDRTGRPAVLP